MAITAASAARASTSTTGTNNNASPTSTLGKAAGLGKDDFMQLLMAQLKNQDPMKPMEDKEFISQLAQFSSLEAVEKMNQQMEDLIGAQSLVQAATLLGKQVTAKLENGEVVTGTISQVKMLDGEPTAVVNGKEINTSLITVIGTEQASSQSAAASSQQSAVSSQSAAASRR
jgi:flagellar basal-body rod modification protein FlgD